MLVKKLILAIDKFALRAPGKRNLAVAIIRLDEIGDFIIWLDSAKVYRTLFPEQRITLIANSVWADLARCLPYWDEVIALDIRRFKRNPFYRGKVLSRIHCEGFSVAIQPTYSRRLIYGDSVIRATSAQQRIGSEGDTSNMTSEEKALSDAWYTRLIPASNRPLMELVRNAEFVSALAERKHHPAIPKLSTFVMLPEHLRLADPYFIAFPGASWHGRQWPVGNFATIIEYLQRRFGWHAVLCGSVVDYAICGQVASNVDTGICLNWAGKTTVGELAELIRGAHMLISNETSAIHLAAAVGTLGVCILGGGHYGRFLPYPEEINGLKPMSVTHKMPCFGCNWECNQPHDPTGPVPCISNVSVEEVLSAVVIAVSNVNRT